jgi:flagellar hook-length control protein FliK
MPQVNLLTIDMAQATETQSVSMKSSGSEQEKTPVFSDVMAKHQEQKSGKVSKESGNADCHKVTADKKTLEEDSSEIESEHLESENIESKAESPLSESPLEENAHPENANNESIDEEISNGTGNKKSSNETAKELLSFILASDEVLTDRVKTKNKDESNTAANVVSINTQPIDKTSKVSNEEKLSKEVEGASQFKSNEIVGKELNKSTNTVSNKVKNDDVDLHINNKKISSLNSETEVIKDGKLKTELKQSLTAQSIKEALFQKNNTEKNGVESNSQKIEVNSLETSIELLAERDNKLIIDEPNKVKAPLTQDINFKGSNVKELEKVVNENNRAIKLDTQPLVTDSTSVNNAKAVEVKPEEFKSAVKIEQSVERVVNHATVVNRSQSDHNQNGQQQGQQSQENSHTHTNNEVDLAKESQQGLHKNEKDFVFSERLTTSVAEKSNLQTMLNDVAAAKILSQQSLNHAEEQSLQNNITKANADSISVQSAKSAINIQAETVSIYRKDFSNAVKEKVMVMINQKIKQLEIRLDPPELGSMHVKLNLQNEQAAVNFVVQNQQAKEALEQNMGKLKEMLADSGVDVGDANIEQRSQQSEDESEFSQHQGENKDEINNDVLGGEMSLSAANLYKASASGVDYYA